MRIKKNLTFVAMAAAGVCAFAHAALAVTFSAQIYNSQSTGTFANGISGNTVVGYYGDTSGNKHGFTDAISSASLITLDDPSAGAGGSTIANGIYGKTIVGEYYSRSGSGYNYYSFLYDGTNWTTLSDPSADIAFRGTAAEGISGSNIVGSYTTNASGDFSAFVYNDGTYTNYGDPNAGPIGTSFAGIDGNNIVGAYIDAAGTEHGVLYNLLTNKWTTLDYPGATETSLGGISGNLIVGAYEDAGSIAQGLVYNLAKSTWTTVDYPSSQVTFLTGIDGDDAVGSGDEFGFIAVVPEPSSFTLLLAAAFALVPIVVCRHPRRLGRTSLA